MNFCDEPDALKLSEEKCWERHRLAEEDFEINCNRADSMRQEFIKQLAEALAKKNNTKPESELKKLTNVQKQKKRAQRLRRARKKPAKGLATKLAERMEDGSRQIVETQEELVRVSSKVSQERCNQCHDCIFL